MGKTFEDSPTPNWGRGGGW